MGLMLSAPFTVPAQQKAPRFAIKATADFGLGKSLDLDPGLEGLGAKSDSFTDYGITLGWRIWQKGRHSMEVNIGAGHGRIPLAFDAASLDYSYNAPADADMDNESYIRFYELDALHQKVTVDRISVPLYFNYNFQACRWIGLHAMIGYKFGVNYSPEISQTDGKAFSYGVYPQYDNLMIDAGYMNGFGVTSLSAGQVGKPSVNRFTSSLLFGAGVEFRIWGPVYVDASCWYEAGMTDIYRGFSSDIGEMSEADAPVTYTVAQGQRMKSLTEYLTLSKLSRFSVSGSLIFRF